MALVGFHLAWSDVVGLGFVAFAGADCFDDCSSAIPAFVTISVATMLWAPATVCAVALLALLSRSALLLLGLGGLGMAALAAVLAVPALFALIVGPLLIIGAAAIFWAGVLHGVASIVRFASDPSALLDARPRVGRVAPLIVCAAAISFGVIELWAPPFLFPSTGFAPSAADAPIRQAHVFELAIAPIAVGLIGIFVSSFANARGGRKEAQR